MKLLIDIAHLTSNANQEFSSVFCYFCTNYYNNWLLMSEYWLCLAEGPFSSTYLWRLMIGLLLYSLLYTFTLAFYFFSTIRMTASVSSWPDWQYPEWRALGGMLTVERWLSGRRADDGAEGLWRVHNGLYDFSSWIDRHPGGSQWLQDTKGIDITEAFEAHHLSPLATKMLATFFVRPAVTRRNSPFTFKPDGFYLTLKARVHEQLKDVEPGPSSYSKRYVELLAASTVLLSILAAVHNNYLLGAMAGVFLTLTATCAHNFFHMRDNWRMYLFNLTLFTVRHWRISHAISHHLYTNTNHDLEISLMEPLIQYFPLQDKSNVFGLMSALYSPLLVYPLVYIGEATKRIFYSSFHSQDLICLVLPTLMFTVGQASLLNTLLMWLYIILVGGFVFGCIGLNSGHHHPDIFHNGDKPREDRDWGLHTLDSTRDRVEVSGHKPLTLIVFGDHTLHHLFPTVDHAHLPRLYPELTRTCRQFGVDYQQMTQWELFKGQFRQLMRNAPNMKQRTN